ncbi:hypothetical protein FRX31_022661 [Thalictrum thalictroides]|uniref:Uncharacterized protein n=1 Tax=Thalictrum thalictroides TaxID=46969 RepID=A0A7J6VS86_THATH|nr:hypothetical protein FRX31_022661 [Thalictrum thalictroides]
MSDCLVYYQCQGQFMGEVGCSQANKEKKLLAYPNSTGLFVELDKHLESGRNQIFHYMSPCGWKTY